MSQLKFIESICMLLHIKQILEYLQLFPKAESYHPQEDLTDKYTHIQPLKIILLKAYI